MGSVDARGKSSAANAGVTESEFRGRLAVQDGDQEHTVQEAHWCQQSPCRHSASRSSFPSASSLAVRSYEAILNCVPWPMGAMADQSSHQRPERVCQKGKADAFRHGRGARDANTGDGGLALAHVSLEPRRRHVGQEEEPIAIERIVVSCLKGAEQSSDERGDEHLRRAGCAHRLGDLDAIDGISKDEAYEYQNDITTPPSSRPYDDGIQRHTDVLLACVLGDSSGGVSSMASWHDAREIPGLVPAPPHRPGTRR